MALVFDRLDWQIVLGNPMYFSRKLHYKASFYELLLQLTTLTCVMDLAISGMSGMCQKHA